MNKTQLIASLTIDYHRIEKGLAMQNTSPNFGVKSGVLKRLYDMNKVYISKFNKYFFITLWRRWRALVFSFEFSSNPANSNLLHQEESCLLSLRCQVLLVYYKCGPSE